MSDMTNPESNSPALLTIAEFAMAIGKTERQVYRYINQGRLLAVPPEQSGLAGIRIPRQELERFLSIRKPRIQMVMSDTELSDVSDVSDPAHMVGPVGELAVQQVPLDRHEAALLRLGAVEKELEMTRKMLTDGGSSSAHLAAKLRELELELVRNESRWQTESEIRAQAEARAQELALALSQAQEKLKKRWWKFW